jgi:hypothetical protein
MAAWYSVEPLPRVGHDTEAGGDIQAGDSWDIRFWRDNRPNAVVTVWVYPVQYDDKPGYRVQVQTEATICADRNDPGNTEQWADAAFRDEPAVHGKLRNAERAARDLAGRYAAGREHVIDWDGRDTRPLRSARR